MTPNWLVASRKRSGALRSGWLASASRADTTWTANRYPSPDLARLIVERPPEDLFEALLEKRRILVILDHLSEMTEATRQRVRPDAPTCPNMALVVTSRLEENLGDVPKSAIQPMRVSAERVSAFLSAYLSLRGVREAFTDGEFFDVCGRISHLVGTRETTVLLIKLFAEQAVDLKQHSDHGLIELPSNIPALMLRYVTGINASLADDVRREPHAVHRDAEALAWACLASLFRPSAARIEEEVYPVLNALAPVILPPVPAFYNHPKDIDDIVNHIAGRVLDQFEIHLDVVNRWSGMVSSVQ